jgi:transmembrane sensor
MKYEEYQLEDFISDESFIQWIINPGSGQSSLWDKWIAEHPDKAHVIALAKEIVLQTRYKNTFQPRESDLLDVWENIQQGKTSERINSILWGLPSRVFQYAAVFLLVSLASLLAWKYFDDKGTMQGVSDTAISGPVTKKAETGEKIKVELPDGSKVILNSESQISYGGDFGKNTRKLELDGEAFFDVAHDSDRPFIIQTGAIETMVVGTSFNIKAYREAEEIKIAVQTGRVEVKTNAADHQSEKIVLVPAEMLTYQKDNGQLNKEKVNIGTIAAWQNNVLILKNADFKEIKETLERWYSVTFVVEEGLKVKEEFSARFNNVPLQRVLDALNYTSRFQYTLIKDKVYVKRKNEE